MRSQAAPRLRVVGALLCAVVPGIPACVALDAPPRGLVPPTQDRVRTLTFQLGRGHKYDVLFVVDNTWGIYQTELTNGFDRFLKPFQDLANRGTFADLHIGVITTDFGAGATGSLGCTPSGLAGGGDQGKLQAIGKKAAAHCQKPKAGNFIAFQFGSSPVHNLPDGQSLLETFACMTSLGNGCGFQHTLESTYAALHNHIVENAGFLRDDARLAVIFATGEDDGSAPPDTDVYDRNQVARYGYLDSYSRQTRFGVMCGDPATFPPYGDSGGPLSLCQPAPNPDGINGPGKLYDVQRYKDFFALPRVQGGVKDSPSDVVLVGFVGPTAPFQVILSNPATPPGQPYLPCGALNESSNPPCVPVLQHSCINPQNMIYFADPAIRLADVIGSAKTNRLYSSCTIDYGPLLADAAGAVLDDTAACVRDPFPRDANGSLVTTCDVKTVTLHPDGTENRVPIQRCDGTGSNTPCWRVARDIACAAASPDGVSVSIDFGTTQGVPNPPPPRSAALVACITRPL